MKLYYLPKLAKLCNYDAGAHPDNIAWVAHDEIVKLRRDAWAVIALDAWLRCEDSGETRTWECMYDPIYKLAFCTLDRNGREAVSEEFQGKDEPAARLAAAQAVFPELPADARAKLGACP